MKEEVMKKIMAWYQENQRPLPWREDTNPYHVWISEVMLQQTRIEAVIRYYHRFMKELPTIKDLANVEDEKLMKLWEGLGYYTRARNLKKAAIQVMERFAGEFPNTYEEILSLPGIREYTASAIASICFHEQQATIDGNVLRVYTRVQNDERNIAEEKTKKDIRKNLIKTLPKDAGTFNQGIMELGEVICIPKGSPKCEICPIQKDCTGYQKDTYQFLPKKEMNRGKKEENYTVLVFEKEGHLALEKRGAGLLEGLWQFPNISGHLSEKKIKNYLKEKAIAHQNFKKGPSYVHIFTHKKWNITSYIIPVENKFTPYTWVSLEDLEKSYALPSAFQPIKIAYQKGTREDEKKCRNFNLSA